MEEVELSVGVGRKLPGAKDGEREEDHKVPFPAPTHAGRVSAHGDRPPFLFVAGFPCKDHGCKSLSIVFLRAARPRLF
jgi:hypothetical protein